MSKSINWWQGVGLITTSALFFSSYGIWSRLMAGQFGQFNQAWLRGLVVVSVLALWLWWTKSWRPIQKKDWPWLLFLATCGGLNQAPYYLGFVHLPLGTAMFLFYAGLTIGLYLVGNLILKEKVGKEKLVALGLAGIGLGLLFKLELNLAQFWPAIFMSLAGLMGGTETALSKVVSGKYSLAQILLFDFGVMVVGNFMFAWLTQEPSLQWQSVTTLGWIGAAGYAVATLAAMTTSFAGYKRIEATIGGVVGLSEVVFAALFGWVLFGERLGWVAWVGGGLILTAAILPNFISSKHD